jgi:hypothetical protein
MPKKTTAESSEGGLVRLKYTFRYREKFDKPNDDWLKCIEATSDELLGTYSKAEDDALSAAFGGRGKKRLNRVFDTIGFLYPDYSYPLRKGKKRKTDASAATTVPKGKKMKVLTHRPWYIETAVVPEFGEGTSSTAEAKQAAPTVQSAEESIVVPKVPVGGPSSSEGPQKHDLTMFPKCNIHTGTFRLGIKLYTIWKAWSRRRLMRFRSYAQGCFGSTAQRETDLKGKRLSSPRWIVLKSIVNIKGMNVILHRLRHVPINR